MTASKVTRYLTVQEYIDEVYNRVLNYKGNSKQMSVGFMRELLEVVDAEELRNLTDERQKRQLAAIQNILNEKESLIRTRSKMIKQLNV